jgi:Tfp pilus assembly protein PilF
MTMLRDPLARAGACLQAGDWQGAVQASRQVLLANPWAAEAWFIRGVANQLLGKIEESIDQYRHAISLAPHNAEAWNNLGVSLMKLRRHAEAEPYLREAIQIDPGYAQAHNNLGNVLQARGEHEQALACYHEALRIKPGYFEVYDHIGLALHARGRLADAVDAYSQAIRLSPSYGPAHMNRALAWLQMGEFERGWAEYEWRFRCPEHPVPEYTQPAWNGAPLAGRTILLWTEQGLGDNLQFIRYAPIIERSGARVLVSSPASLCKILATSPGVAEVICHGSPLPEFDWHAPLMSLPRILRTTSKAIPAEVPYLSADPSLVERWRSKLAGEDGFRIGIAWQGNPDHKKDRHRSFPLLKFEPLARVPGTRLFSLQQGHGMEQLAAAADHLVLRDLGPELQDFEDTAAVIRNLDLIVAPDTSLAHLAGALGTPVWVALPFAPDWRWFLDRDDTPWYPTMRLYRQRRWGDWDDVIERITSDLQRWLERRGNEAGSSGRH